MPKNILIVGATSAIARALAYECAAKGYNIFLASRDLEELNLIATDLTIRYGVKVFYGALDINNFAMQEILWQQVLEQMQTIHTIVLAVGYLGNKDKLDTIAEQQKIINTNFSSVITLLNQCVHYFEAKKQGTIVALSSVAGDRGRQSNYIYGSAKGALALYLQGLRNRLAKTNIHVLTVKLGFVDTAMTFGLPGLFLVAHPSKIAQQIMVSLAKKKNTVYLPKFWRYIMLIIKIIPENIFKKLKL